MKKRPYLRHIFFRQIAWKHLYARDCRCFDRDKTAPLLVKTRLFNPMLQTIIYTTIFFNQNHLWQHLSSISDPRRSERTKRPTSFTTCLTPPATNSNGCAADTHRTAGVARLEALRFHGAKWGHFAICHLFLPSGISLPFFSYFRPIKTTADEPLPNIPFCASPTGMWKHAGGCASLPGSRPCRDVVGR